MYSLLFVSLVGCLLSLGLTPLVRDLAHALGLVDRPDSRRKFHQKPVPRLGGVAIAIAYFGAYGISLLFKSSLTGSLWNSGFSPVFDLLPALGAVFLTGLLDDLVQLAPWQKLGGQIVAAILAYLSGLQIQLPVLGATHHWWWSLPLTIGWLVLCANAVNLIDGLDGLATGVGLLAAATALAAGLMQHNLMLAVAAAPLAGALLAFLRFNRNPATIFLGDSGSLFIGFLLGCYGVSWSSHASTILNAGAPLLMLAVPLLDTSLAIVRRFLRKYPIFQADRGHIHHRLLDRGIPVHETALVLHGCCAISMSLALIMLDGRYEVPAGLAFLFLVGLAVHFLGFAELKMAVRMLTDDSFRNVLRSRLLLQQLSSKLELAGDPEECWHILKEHYREFGFCEVRMQLAGELYVEQAQDVSPSECWNLEIPLSDRNYVAVSCGFYGGARPEVVALVPEIIRGTIGTKLSGFERQALEGRISAGSINLAKPVIAR